MKPIYFISDAHLGSWALTHRRQQERRLVSFLDSIKNHAGAIYLLGDIFDFWHEYRLTVPKGYTRLLGKISELTDNGVEVHFFTGNHDLWVRDYFERECGMIVHREICCTTELYGKLFYLAHGDGLGDKDRTYKFLRSIFHNRICQRLFAALHPRWGLWFGLKWAEKSQLKHRNAGGVPPFKGENDESLLCFAREYLSTHPDINYFVFGHRHLELNYPISDDCQVIILGDWISQFTYAKFDGNRLTLENYIEGESNP